MNLPVLTISDVTERQLCTGCGVCAAVEPGRFRMGDAPEFGRRPFLREGAAAETGAGVRVCPGASLEHTFDRGDAELDRSLMGAWGPVLEVWEGYAADGAIRHGGSSGGAATALALYCLEREGMAGVLHTAAREDAPYMNETVMSTGREDLLARTGSRYAPASPAEGLGLIEGASAPCVFIGKPCDVAGVQAARRERPRLDEKLGLTVAFFCAGVPSTRGTLELLKSVGVGDPASVRSLRYRGNGWPGRWTVEFEDASGEMRTESLSYEESWGFLQRYRQWRCYICPDHTGEFADIAVGDPWYRPVEPGEPGKSLLVARTRRGREILHAAAAAGYIRLETKDATLLPRSQPNLLATRGGLWGRLLVLRVFGAAVPRYRGFPAFRFWLSELSLVEKAKSLTGTARRVFRKRLRGRVEIREGAERAA